MPDWITHIGIAFLLATILKVNKKSLVLLGAIIPDLVTKFKVILRLFVSSNVESAFEIFHTPLGVFLICLTIAPIFKEKYEKVILYLIIGAITHLLLDSLQKPAKYMFLWPLSWRSYSFSIIWSEDPRPLVVTLVLLCIYFLLSHFKSGIKGPMNY